MIYSQPSTSICTTISKLSKIGSVNLMPNAQILVLATLDGVLQYNISILVLEKSNWIMALFLL